MRNIDLWDRYLDNSGKILRGCLEFMVLDGTTQTRIFDSDGTPLSNPQLTDERGRTEHQVFVNSDCLIYFYKYIGDGRFESIDPVGIDTSDETQWQLQYTAENIDGMSLHITSDSPISVSSVEELKELDPDEVPLIGEKKMIQLLGYYESGDKEQVTYIWDSESELQANGGSVIENNDLQTGRWILVHPSVFLDVRHFGVFPKESIYASIDQSLQISRAVDYADSEHLRVFFPNYTIDNGQEIEYSYYRYSNLSLVFEEKLEIADGLTFVDGGPSSTWTLRNGCSDTSFKFNSANTNLVANFARASWNLKSLTRESSDDSFKYVIDSMSDSSTIRSLTGCDVLLGNVLVDGFTFEKCNFDFADDNREKLRLYNTFIKCTLHPYMFHSWADLNGRCTQCSLDLEEFYTAGKLDLWQQWRMSDSSNPYIDYQNLPNVGFPYFNDASTSLGTTTVIHLSNVRNSLSGSPVNLPKLSAQTHLVMENCTGYFDVNGGVYLELRNCDVRLVPHPTQTIEAYGSKIQLEGSGEVTCWNLNVKDCSIEGSAGASFKFNETSIVGSSVNVPIQTRTTVMKDSIFGKAVRIVPASGTAKTVTYHGNSVEVSWFLKGVLDNNIFNGKLTIDGNEAYETYGATDCLADGLVIQNNRSNLSNPDAWEVIPLGAMTSDALNGYVFKNNSGGFISSVSTDAVVVVTRDPEDLPDVGGLQEDQGTSILASVRWSSGLGPYYDSGNRYFCTMRLFTMGREDLTQRFRIDALSKSSNASNIYLSGPSSVMAKLTTVDRKGDGSAMYIVPDLKWMSTLDGNTWQIRNFSLGYNYYDEGTVLDVNITQLDHEG